MSHAENSSSMSPLPLSQGLSSALIPRGLNRQQAAQYIGCSASTFDGLVARGQMPAPVYIGSRPLWDRIEIDLAFQDLPRAKPGKKAIENPWDTH